MKLGKSQVGVLESLIIHGPYYGHFSCSWMWDTRYNTRKILDSLVKRHLVEIKTIKPWKGDKTEYHGAYVITAKGRSRLTLAHKVLTIGYQ